MKENQFGKLLAFLERLDEAKIAYTMEHSRDDAIMVSVIAPGEYWEIEFLEEGNIEVERYRSNGKIDDETVLEELFARYSDEEPPTGEAVNQDDAVART